MPGELEALFDTITTQWGRLDILVHSIAFAPKDDLQRRAAELLCRGFRQGNGHFLSFFHPNGEAGGAADDRGRVRCSP